MIILRSLPVCLVFGALGLADSPSQAQVVTSSPGETVVVSPPPPVVLDESVVIKERRRLFRPRERVYIVKPRSKRISVPATTTVVESFPSRRTTTIEPPAPIVGKPSVVSESPATYLETTPKGDDLPPPALELEKPATDGEVRYLKPSETTTTRPATIIRSTPR